MAVILSAYTASTQYVAPSGDVTGARDAAAINAAVAKLPAQGGTVTLIPSGKWNIAGGLININRSGVVINAEGCYINGVGAGDVFRMFDNSGTFWSPVFGGGIDGNPIIDISAMSAGASGVHIGDLLQAVCNVSVQNLTNAGYTGVHFDNANYWTEQLRAHIYVYNCNVVFDVTGALTSTSSYGRGDIQIYVDQVTATNDGVIFQNGALLYDGALAIRGNFVSSASVLTSCLLRITGTIPAGHPGAGNSSGIYDCRLEIGAECTSGAHTPTTIIRGAGTNLIKNCYGLLDFGTDGAAYNFTNAAGIGILFPFMGTIRGDAVLGVGGQGFAPGAAWNSSGGLALGNFTAAVPISSSGTIDTTIPLRRVTETGNVSGMILGAGSYDGQLLWIVNESNFTITFAASGTSHVADGVSDVIPALCARNFIYDGNDTNLWYRAG